MAEFKVAGAAEIPFGDAPVRCLEEQQDLTFQRKSRRFQDFAELLRHDVENYTNEIETLRVNNWLPQQELEPKKASHEKTLKCFDLLVIRPHLRRMEQCARIIEVVLLQLLPGPIKHQRSSA